MFIFNSLESASQSPTLPGCLRSIVIIEHSVISQLQDLSILMCSHIA